MRAKFNVVTPIFIGSGDSYYPQDFFIDDKLYFIDRDKFVKKIIKEGKFEKFLEVSSDIKKLLGFIDDNFSKDIARSEAKINDKLADELIDSYSRPIEAFIKDSFYFKPIIPGSTIKGAIRTALLDYLVYKNPDIVKKYKKDINKNREKNLHTIFFCNENKNHKGFLNYDAKKDILKALFVDDFKAKEFGLEILKPINRPYKKNKDNTIPVILECLIDGEFEGEIRIEENLLKNDKSLRENKFFKDEPLNIELIKKSLKHFFNQIVDIESKRFRATTPNYTDYLIKIGKHAGAGSKSLNNLRSIYIKPLKKDFNYQLSVWIDNNENPFGWGRLEFEK